jgi:poly(hydroxyalkanoate) depolymerase family esterase
MVCTLLAPNAALAAWSAGQEIIGENKTWLYIPETAIEDNDKIVNHKRALVVTLHGCAQSATELKEFGNWESTAEKYGLVVAIPDVDQGVIFGCWDYDQAGDTSGHAEDILKIVENLKARPQLNIDPQQVYITGLSSGAALALQLACEAPEVFAGVGAVAGPSVGSDQQQATSPTPPNNSSQAITMCNQLAGQQTDAFKTQIASLAYGDLDKNGGGTPPIPPPLQGGRELVDVQWTKDNAQVFLQLFEASSLGDAHSVQNGKGEARVAASDESKVVVSLVKLFGVGHAWPAGSEDPSFGGGSWIHKGGFNYPAYVTEWFFANNRRVNRNQPPVVTIMSGRQSGPDLIVEGRVTDPDPEDSTVSLRIKFVDICDEDSVLISETDVTLSEEGVFAHTAAWPKDHSFYKPVLVAADDQGASAVVEGALIKVGDPPRITLDATISGQCVDLSGTAVQGASELTAVRAKVGSGSFESANGTANWHYEKCGLASGKHTIIAKVEDRTGGYDCRTVVVDIQPNYAQESGTILDHVNRYAIYPNTNYPDAPSKGWGLCDRTFVEMVNSELGTSGVLVIYGTEDKQVWCADSQNLPVSE